MAINPEVERESCLNTQDFYDICDFATQAAYDDGFMNTFIFERALYVFAAIRLYEEHRDTITELAAENMNSAWDYLLNEKIVDDMIKNYSNEVNMVAAYGEQWFEDYTKYAHSARGLLNTIQTFTGDIVTNAAQQFKNISDNGEVQEVLEIADKWGLNREGDPVLDELPTYEGNAIIKAESVFED